MSKEVFMNRYDYNGGYVEIICVGNNRMYEVWESISDAYGYNRYLRGRTKIYPRAKDLALDIVRTHDDLTSV